MLESDVHKLGSVLGIELFGDRGGVHPSQTNNDLTFHAVAALVDQILRGANPAEVPFAEIDAGWLAVNLAAAAEIGFTFPLAVLERANQVIN